MKAFCAGLIGLLAFCGIATAQLGPLGGVVNLFGAQPTISPGFTCTGGTVSTVGTTQINTFTAGGTLACAGNGVVNYLLVGGGGGGGAGTASGGGGGGAGGLLSGSQFVLAGSYPVVVGTGGSPGAGCSLSTGGSISVVGGQRIHTFTNSGTFNPSGTCTVSYLVVGGGGNGGVGQNGVGSGGGGGCGGVASGSVTVSPGARAITVGGAGADSTFQGFATGSGGGAGGAAGGAGAAGGCGGGGGANGGPAHAGGAGSQGGAGGTAPATSTGAGGGGGMAGAGAPGVFPQSGGAGGGGFTSSISGASATYACGGGGGGGSSVGGGAGCSGAGTGGGGSLTNGGNANFYGSGGGGGGNGAATLAGTGFQGIVIISYPVTAGAGSGVAGTNTTLFSLAALGGGGGGDIGAGGNGGSGGGGSSTGGATRAGGTGLAGQGFAGGAGIGTSTGGGGGGGCGALGIASSATAIGGAGGGGCTNSASGTATTYAGGGGGWGTTAGAGGAGGGGAGCATASCTGTAGAVNTGSGGGGGSAAGGAGGRGVVLVTYPVPNLVQATTTFDPANKGADVTLSNGNLTASVAQNGSNHYEAGRVIPAQGTGKYYFECSFPNLDTPADGAMGIVNSSLSVTSSFPGADSNGAGIFGSNTNWFVGGSGSATAASTWQQGDTVGIAVDTGGQLAWQIVMHAGSISNWNGSPTANPATGVGGQSLSAVVGPYYAACYENSNGTPPLVYTGNFGATPYQIQVNGGNVPSGFSNWPTGSVLTFTASGPSSGIINNPSTNFTVAPVGEATFNGSQSITISDGSQGGTITPSVGSPGTSTKTVTPTNGLANFTFTYTPVSTPSITLAFTNGQGWPNPASLTYATANPPTFTATGPSTGPDTVTSTNFTVTISAGTWSGGQTVTISDGGQGGTITPSVGSPGTSTATVTPTNGTTAFTFTYKPAVVAAVTLAFTNGQSWANPASLVYNSTAKPTYTATGPTGGTVSVASTNFTVAINAGNTWDGTQTVTISDGQAGGNRGTITPSVGGTGTGSVTVTPTASTTSFTFTYTPAITGAITVAFTNGQTWANPASLTYTSTGVTTTYTVTGPSSGADLNPSTNFTATISTGSWASPDTVTIADGSQGGTVTPSVGAPGTAPVTVHPVSGSTFTFTYTPAVAGSIVLSFTNGQGWGNPANLTYTSTGGNYTAIGPSGGAENVTSTNFTITLGSGTFTGSETITIADGSQGGLFTPSVGGTGTSTVTVTPPNLSTSFTFTYKPVVAGNITLAFTNNSSLNNPTSLIYTSTAPSTTFTVTGPSSGSVNVASTNFTATISTGAFNGANTITVSDNGSSGLFAPPNSAGCTQATNFLARTSGLSATETTAYTNLICGLVTDGVITGTLGSTASCGAPLDALYILGTNTTTTAALNLCGTSYSLTTNGTCQFTVDTGYTGDASTCYFDTGFNPSTAGGNYAQNSAMLGAYVLSSRSVQEAWAAIGATGTADSKYSYIIPLPTDTHVAELNAFTFPAYTSTNAQGSWLASRTSSSAISIYLDGQAVSTPATTSVGVPTSDIVLLGFNDTDVGHPIDFSGDQIAAAWFGSGVTGTVAQKIQNRVNLYMTSLGINVYGGNYGIPYQYNYTYSPKTVSGDTWFSTWADDGKIYVTYNDGFGWNNIGGSNAGSNIAINTVTSSTPAFVGTSVNTMAAWGGQAQTGSDGNTFKSTGIISVGGVLYWFVQRDNSTVLTSAPFLQTAKNAQIIKSSDHGVTWTPTPPSTAQPYASPQFPVATYAHFGAPSFIQYGQNYSCPGVDNCGTYVYAISNDGFWNNGNNLYLGRVLISAIGNLSAADWQFYQGGDGSVSSNWGSISTAVSVLSGSKTLGVPGVQYVPALGQYVMMEWYYPAVAQGLGFLDPAWTIWSMYTAPHPWGPWTSSGGGAVTWAPSGYYNPVPVPSSVNGNSFTVFTAGNFNTYNNPQGEYTLTEVPVTPGTTFTPALGTTSFTFAYTPVIVGTESLSFTNNSSWSNPAALAYTSSGGGSLVLSAPATGAVVSGSPTAITPVSISGGTAPYTVTIAAQTDNLVASGSGTVTGSGTPTLTISGTSTQVNNSLATLTVAGSTTPSFAGPLAGNGNQQPLTDYPTGGASFYDGVSNSTWVTWNGYNASGASMVYVRVYNHSTATWGAPVAVAPNPLGGLNTDAGPGIVMDQYGYVHIFYGAHFSSIFYSVSTNPRNPFAWTAGNQITLENSGFTYISPILLNGLIWVVTTASPQNSQDVVLFGGVPNANGAPMTSLFGPTEITAFTGGFGAWAGNVVVQGNLICFPFTFISNNFTHEGVFYGCYNTTTNSFQNISGSTVVGPGSLPMSLATAQAGFTVVPWDGSSSTVIPSQAVDPNGNTHVLYSTGIGTGSLLFEAYFTPVAQSPGPSLAVYNSQPYYTCTNNVAVTTVGQLNTALAAAQPAGTCINLAPGTYSSASGFGISHGGTGPSKTGYVVVRCTTMPFSFSAGALQGEGSGCVLKYTGGGTDTGNVVGFNSNVSFVMFDGIEFNGNGNQANVCLDVENPGSTAGTNHHIWALNSDMHNCGQAGLQWNYTDWLFVIHNVWHDNASANGDDGSGLSFFEPAGITYTPTPGNPDYWHSNTTGNTYNMVIAYNFGYHNFNHFGTATDGEGIIIDSLNGCNSGGSGTTCPYNGNVLVMGNIMYGNGGEGIEPFSMIGPPNSTSHIDLINNTVYSNGWDGDITGTFGTAQCYSDGTINLNWWNNLCISVTGGSAKGCDGANGTTACTVRDSDGKTPQTNNYSNNMAYPANIRSFENTPSGTYTIGGTNGNFDGTNPNLTSLVPMTAASGGGSTSVSNFAPQAGSPVIGAGRAFDLWQQSSSVDIGACVRSLSVCPTSAGGVWVTGIALPGHADQSTLQPTLAPLWNGVQAWWGQSTNFPTLPDNGFTATSTTLGTWSGATEFIAAGSAEIAMFSTVTTNQYPYGATPFPVVYSETIQGGSNTNLRVWPFNGAAATGNDIVTYNAVDSLSNHAAQQTTALNVATWDSTVWNNPASISLLTHGTFVSPSTNLTIGYQIYLPPNYTTGSNFPVVYFLHDRTSNEDTLPTNNASVLQTELNSLITAGTIPPMIAVFPNGGQNSQYVNPVYGAPAYGNYMGETQILELIQNIDATYKTNPTRAGRALQGFSMGGQGCERLGFKYPNLFSSLYCIAPAIVNAAYMVANQTSLLNNVYDGTAAANTTAYTNNTAQNIIVQNAANMPGTAIHVLIGSTDNACIPVTAGCSLLAFNQAQDSLMTSLGVAHDALQLASGCGHDLTCDLTAVNGGNWIFASANFATAVQTQNIVDDATVPAGYKVTFNEEFPTLNTISTVNQSTFVPGVQWYVGNEQCCIAPTDGSTGQMYPTPDPTTGSAIYPFALDPGGGLDLNLTRLNNNWNSAVPTSLAGATAGVPVSQGPGGGFSQQYGYFEMSAQFPPDEGPWPAFWMLPVHNTVNNGEIDIVEAYTKFQQSYCATVHDYITGGHDISSCDGPVSEFPWTISDGYHIYSLLWTPTLLTFSIDGHFYFSTPPLPDNAQGGPYYLLYDLGIGMGGQSTNATTSPQTMKIKYIRGYQLTPGENLAATFDPNPTNAGFYVGMSNLNLTATITANIGGTAYQVARSTRSHSTGKYYFECTWGSDGNSGGSPANMVAGIFNGSASLGLSSGGTNPGADTNASVVYGTTGWFSNNISNGDFTSWVQGDTIGIAIDTDAKLVWQQVYHAGASSNWNGALNGNPATGTGGVSISSITGPYFAGCGGNPGATASNVSVTGNFGGSTYTTSTVPTGGTGFGQGVPAGFKNW